MEFLLTCLNIMGLCFVILSYMIVTLFLPVFFIYVLLRSKKIVAFILEVIYVLFIFLPLTIIISKIPLFTFFITKIIE
jgi:hypothetical protein